MDRLIIESILSDVNEIFLSKDHVKPGFDTSVIMGYKAVNTEQIIHAFTALKDITAHHEVELVICKTMVAGIYDLELCTEALDEPIRIANKTIANEILGEIEDHINSNHKLMLSTNVSEDENWISIDKIAIKSCDVKPTV